MVFRGFTLLRDSNDLREWTQAQSALCSLSWSTVQSIQLLQTIQDLVSPEALKTAQRLVQAVKLFNVDAGNFLQ